MPESLSQTLPALEPALTLSQRLQVLHARMQTVAPGVERVAFAVHHPRNDLLSTYVSHNARGDNLLFDDQPLAGIPSLRTLAETRCCRVIHDMQAELPPVSQHSRWLLDQGWRSSFTAPLFWGEQLLGFLFLNASSPAAFTPPVLERLQPHVELLASLVTNELGQLSNLRLAVQLALELTHLRKPGPLDPQERQTMDTHVSRGLDVVNQMVRGLHLAASPKLEMLRNVVAGHHELLDGSGYPLGLQAEQISLEARIVAVADIYDALTQARVYKPALSEEESVRILNDMVQAQHLDPLCVTALLEAREQRQAIAAAYRDP